MKFVFFHGSFVGPQYIWWPYLAKELRLLGQDVIAPQFPVDFWEEVKDEQDFSKIKKQTLTNWTSIYQDIKKSILPSDELCFVGHSLGPLFMLHMLELFPLQLNCAIFVAPFFTKLDTAPIINHVNSTFYKDTFDFSALRRCIPTSYVLYSTNDPHVKEEQSLLFAKNLNSAVIKIEGLSHFATSIQMVRFPLLLELCKSRIPGSAYIEELQKPI